MVYPSCNYNENLYPFIHTPEDFDDYSDSEMSQTSAAETPSTHTLNASANPGPPNPAPRVIRYHVCYRTHLSGSDSDADSDSEMSETSDTEVAGTHTSSTSANRQDDTTIEDSVPLATQSHYPPAIQARGDIEGGSISSTPRPVAGPVRSGPSSLRRIAPYEPPRDRPTLRLKAGAGPSSLPSHVRPVPTVQPSGGPSEKRASAKTNRTDVDEDEVPKSKRPRALYRSQPPRVPAVRFQRKSNLLVEWAWKQRNSPKAVWLNDALEAAIKFMEKNYEPVYDEPCLYLGDSNDGPTGSARSVKSWELRATTRKHYQELSRYFRLPDDKLEWQCPSLLTELLLRLGVDPNS